MGRRAVAIWLVLFAVYLATIGLHAFGSSDYGGDEPHYLLTAQSIVSDGDFDVFDDYRDREYREFYPYTLDPHGALTRGRLHEPHGIGFPLLISPAYAIAGAKGVEVLMAAIAALAMALAYLLAVRVAPDPWALGATLAVGLSPPMLAYSTAVYPELAAGAALAGAALLALEFGPWPPQRKAAGCFLLLALLPWLGPKFALPGVVIAWYAFRAIRRAGRRWVALATLDIAGISVAFYVGLNEGLYGGPTPYAATLGGASATDASFPLGYLERAYRLVAIFIDRDYGLLRWAPVLALALFGAWLLVRERRRALARMIPEIRMEQTTATLCALVAGTQLLSAAFLAPTMFGFWFPGRHVIAALPVAVPLVALGLRRAPRIGALLAAITVAGSAWVYADLRLGDGSWVTGLPDAPFGPLDVVFPVFSKGSTLPFVVAGVIGAVAAALIVLAVRHSRSTAGTTRARYSP
jgi:hypothetical protein